MGAGAARAASGIVDRLTRGRAAVTVPRVNSTPIIASALLLGSLIPTVAGPAAPASAERVCITRAEYRKIDDGMKIRRVKRIVGGAPYDSYPTEHNSVYAYWHHCGDDGDAFIHFQSPNSGKGPKVVVDKIWKLG